jgi:alkylhydroperoxidase family enzyme
MIRLQCLMRGHDFASNVKLFLRKSVLGDVPDLIRALLYRPNFFGKGAVLLHQAVTRGPSEWTVGERELFTAFVCARSNSRACFEAHSAVADRAFRRAVVADCVADPARAPVSPNVRAMLLFLDKLTVLPDQIGAADIAALRALGISRSAIRDGIYIAMLGSVFSRMATALGVEPMTAGQLRRLSFVRLNAGYIL